MKKVILSFLAGAALTLAAVFFLPCCVQNTQSNFHGGAMNAVLWQQTSAEYRALCYQAYNIALERIKAAKSTDKPSAIILDLDETILDNAHYNAVQLKSDNGLSDLVSYQNSASARAMPGAEDFLKAVDALSVDIFYITNRHESTAAATLKNLQALNFPQADNDHLIVNNYDSKDPRFSRIEKSCNVIAYLGDGANDFPMNVHMKNMAFRNAATDANKSLFGGRYIVLPNPVYGQWRGAYAEGYSKMSAQDKHKADMDALSFWQE